MRYNFMGNTSIFQFLHINALNYHYFHTDCSTFFNKKTLEKFQNDAFSYRKIHKNVYKRLPQL